MRIGQYELLERIGIGGMAEVFRARQTGEEGFERFVAIKRILPGIAADQDFVKMFIDEAKIAVQLSHPNIAQIYDLGREGDTYYIAQELVHGRDMGAIVKRQSATDPHLPIQFVLHVGMKICEALQHAHTAHGTMGRPLNIIHRDVSPSNILVSFEGAVKVIDFGLAKAVGRLVTTQSGIVKGKLAYLSAEQARGEEIDHRSDIFSLGTCMFEWLTGQRLFLRKNDPDTVVAVQQAMVPPLRAIRPDVPNELQSIVKLALEPDPTRRFQSAMELHDALLSYAYDTRSVMRRGAVGEYVRSLFPEENDEDETFTGQTGDLPRTDTEPRVEVLMRTEHAPQEPDESSITVDRGRSSLDAAVDDLDDLVDAVEDVEDVTSDFMRDHVLDADSVDVDLDDLDDIDEVPVVEDDPLARTTQSGRRAREALQTDRPPAPPIFDDATGNFQQEALALADAMEGMEDFEDTTAPGTSRRKRIAEQISEQVAEQMIPGMGTSTDLIFEEETRSIDPVELDRQLEVALGREKAKTKKAADKRMVDKKVAVGFDVDDETVLDLESEVTSVEPKE